MKITPAEAQAFFAHPSQQVEGLDPETLPDWALYYANGPICVVFHAAPWPGLWFTHYGAKPEGWGHLVEPARESLHEAFSDLGATRFLGWTRKSNKQAVSFARRVGFVEDGEMPIPGDTLIMTGWIPWR